MAIYNSNGQIIDAVNEKPQVTGLIANEYDATSTYSVGDYASHEGKVYKCKTAIATAENWNSAKWDEVVVGDEVNGLRGELDKIDIIKGAMAYCLKNIPFINASAYNTMIKCFTGDIYPNITAVYNKNSGVISYMTSLEDIKDDIVVTYYSDSESNGTVINKTDYTLSGSLGEGTNYLEVAYSNCITYISVKCYKNAHYYDLNNIMKISGNALLHANKYSGVVINMDSTQSEKKRTFVLDDGVTPFEIYQTGEDTEYYPIPVPPDAVRAVASISPSGRQLCIYTATYNSALNKCENVENSGYKNGEAYIEFIPSNNRILAITSRYSASDDEYVSEPTDFTLDFTKNRYHWNLNGLMKVNANALFRDNSQRGAVINNDSQQQGIKRTFVTSYGVSPFANISTGQEFDYYPIPAPDDATKVTVTITPSERQICVYIATYYESLNLYKDIALSGYQTGTAIMEFSAGANKYIAITSRYDASDSTYSTEPTGLTIDFE